MVLKKKFKNALSGKKKKKKNKSKGQYPVRTFQGYSFGEEGYLIVPQPTEFSNYQ